MPDTVKKHFSITSKAPDVPRVIRFIGSDESIDRDGDTHRGRWMGRVEVHEKSRRPFRS